jgi:hypothetical protein
MLRRGGHLDRNIERSIIVDRIDGTLDNPKALS